MVGTSSIEGPLWQFALEFYQREGVAEACLKLQDLVEADVNILIFGIYAATQRNILLGPSELQEVDAKVRQWRSEIIVGLRRLRIRLKTGPAPGPNPDTDALRNRVKAAELLAEQIELGALSEWLEARVSPAAAQAVNLSHLLNGLITFFRLQKTGHTTGLEPELDAAVRTLISAIEGRDGETTRTISR